MHPATCGALPRLPAIVEGAPRPASERARGDNGETTEGNEEKGDAAPQDTGPGEQANEKARDVQGEETQSHLLRLRLHF